jgi:hypothetical protein
LVLLPAVAWALAFGTPAIAEAWLPAFLLWASLAAGALGALALGHLLDESWLAPVRAPLEAAARGLPLVALMAVPVLVGVEWLYPWSQPVPPPMPAPRAAWFSPLPFRLRGAGFLLLWCGLAWWLARAPRPGRWRAAVTLMLLLPSVTLAAQDWSLSRDPGWWGSLQGVAVWVQGMMSALAAAALVTLARGTMPGSATGEGEALERALLALALATIWLWFVQFIVVWMADLPEEAGWYLRRMEPPWAQVKLAAAAALVLAIALAAPPRHRPWRLALVCLLLLACHGAHLWWVVRPDAPLAVPPAWLDAALPVLLGLGFALWWGAGLRRNPGMAPHDEAAP